jgi:hypothetical protein
MTLCALLLSMAGATLTYLASTQQKLLSAPLRPHTRLVAVAIAAGGVVAWLEAAGTGAGIATTLTTWMLTWVALPYLAWWRGASEPTRADSR